MIVAMLYMHLDPGGYLHLGGLTQCSGHSSRNMTDIIGPVTWSIWANHGTVMVQRTGPLCEYVELGALATFFFFVKKVLIGGLNELTTIYYHLSSYYLPFL